MLVTPTHNSISIKTDMKVSEAKEYTIIVGNEWLKKAKALLNYELCKLIIRCEQEEPEETAKLAYTIFTSNGKPLDNVKADKEEIMVNGKLICWPYYDILRRTFDKKPGKKAKYSYWWHGPCAWYCLILRKKLKEVQKSFENEPSEIQLLVIEQRKPSSEKRKVDIENLLARNSPVISKEDDTPR
ncbi:hypothetical protein G9A89_009137 [Geosiphon pyriformis]|nr:hypothetical protein G9A89_009137 [Geosiphon pyriformis]